MNYVLILLSCICLALRETFEAAAIRCVLVHTDYYMYVLVERLSRTRQEHDPT